MAATGNIDGPNILGRYSILHIVEEICFPMIKNQENAVLSPKYMYIKKLIPVVLDLTNVQYTCWSSLFRDAARADNLFHHIDPTIPTPPPDDATILWCQQDAVLLTWIYATISPYLLNSIIPKTTNTTTAMDAWARLRDICQQHDTTMQKKKRRFIHIDLNEDYDHRGRDNNDNDNCVDLFSNLSDELLIYILSLSADMKTAGRTSILSKRWTHVWTHLKDLDFNDMETTDATLKYIHFPQPEMDKFVNWVNRVISANRAPYIGTLRINFPLNSSYAAHIDNWLKFAFSKEVRNLELSLRVPCRFYKIISTNPALILNTTLESLHLKTVGIKRTLLEWVIANCLNLRHLSLYGCMGIADAPDSSKHHPKLVISSPKLKHLEFFYSLQRLKIDALHLSTPNLISFICFEFKIINVEYHSVPSLVDVTFGGSCLHHLDTMSGISSLETLTFLWDKAYYASSRFPTNSGFPTFISGFPTNSGFPTFNNIKQLEIVYSRHDDYSLQDDYSQQDVSLSSLTELMGRIQMGRIQMGRKSLAPNNTQLKEICSHQHLKTVEYFGYAGCAIAADLALYLARRAPMLRRFIFDTRQPQFIVRTSDVDSCDRVDKMEMVRSRTELLAEQIRRSTQGLADVVIL